MTALRRLASFRVWFSSASSLLGKVVIRTNLVAAIANRASTMKSPMLLILWLWLNFCTSLPPSASQIWMFVVGSASLIKMEELALASCSACWAGEPVFNTWGRCAAQFLALASEGFESSRGLHEVLIPMILRIQVHLPTVWSNTRGRVGLCGRRKL